MRPSTSTPLWHMMCVQGGSVWYSVRSAEAKRSPCHLWTLAPPHLYAIHLASLDAGFSHHMIGTPGTKIAGRVN